MASLEASGNLANLGLHSQQPMGQGRGTAALVCGGVCAFRPAKAPRIPAWGGCLSVRPILRVSMAPNTISSLDPASFGLVSFWFEPREEQHSRQDTGLEPKEPRGSLPALALPQEAVQRQDQGLLS